MRSTLRFAVALAVSLLLVSQVFASGWDSILPAGRPQAGQPEVVTTQKVLTVGESLLLPLPGNKSYSCPVEVEGVSVKIVAHKPLESVTLQAVTPGTSMVRISRKFWRDSEGRKPYQLVQRLVITVQSSFKDSLLPGQNNKIRQKIPLPVSHSDLEWEGYLSQQGEELLTVVTDSKEWNDLWKNAFGAPAPEVDFEKYGIACVFLGFHADWLYHIELGEPCVKGDLQSVPFDLIEIILELQGPFRASGQYHMKAYEKKKGYGMIVQKGSCNENEYK